MDGEDNQIVVPPSFVALCADARGRLRLAPAAVRERYELCEDLACSLVEPAQAQYERAPSEAGILNTMHVALASDVGGLSREEAGWVVRRLAELLQWQAPGLPRIRPSASGDGREKRDFGPVK